MTLRSARLGFAALASLALAPAMTAQDVGTAGLHLGVARAIDEASEAGAGGVGVRAHLAFRAGRFALGPEAAIDFVGAGQRVLQAGGVARMDFRTGGWRPYVVGGLGSYTWQVPNRFQLDLVGASLGGGILRRADRGPALGLEARYHWSLQGTGGGGRRDLLTLAGGLHLVW